MNKKTFRALLLALSCQLAVPAALLAQTTTTAFTINGKLKDMTAGEIYLIYAKDGQRQMDSAAVKDGAYVFSGTVSDAAPAFLLDISPMGIRPKESQIAQVFLEPGVLTIAHTDSFSNTSFTGSVANTDFQSIHDAEKPYNHQLSQLIERYQTAHAAGDSATMAGIETAADSLQKEENEQVYGKFVRTHPSSKVALYALQMYAARNMEPAKLQPLFDGLSASAKASKDGKALQERITIATNTAIGKPALEFTQNDTAGKPVSLSSFRGKYVLLDFWASWCGPCRAENPNVVAAYNKYHGKGFEILSVSLDRPNDRDKWLAAVYADHLTWTHVSDLQFWGNAVAKEYGINSIPQNFLIDPQGNIVGKSLRGDDLEKKLADIYKN